MTLCLVWSVSVVSKCAISSDTPSTVDREKQQEDDVDFARVIELTIPGKGESSTE